MPDWVEKSLGSVFKVKHGFAFKGEYFTDSQQPHALVTPGNFSIGGGFQSQKQKYYSGPIPSEYVLDPGSVVVTMTDLSKQSDTLGYAALIPDDGITWLHNQRVGLLQFHDLDQADPVFFSYLMRTQAYRAWVVGSATGTTVKHTAPSRIESFRCLVPPVEQQRRIASVLKSLDDKIDLNRRINQTLEAMAQAIFKSWFVDFDPVKAKIAAKAEGRDPLSAAMTAISGKPNAELDTLPPDQFATLAATAALFPDEMEESELSGIPKGWRSSTLGEQCAYLNRGISPKYIDEGGVLVLNQKCIRDFSLDTSKGRRHDPNQRNVSGRELQLGDVLVNSTGVGTLGRVAQVLRLDEPTIVDSHVTVVRPGPKLNSAYLGQWVVTKQPDIEAMGEGSTGQTELSRGKLACMSILVPDQAVLEAFAAAVAPMQSLIAARDRESLVLQQTRDTLLPRLLSGELQPNVALEGVKA